MTLTRIDLDVIGGDRRRRGLCGGSVEHRCDDVPVLVCDYSGLAVPVLKLPPRQALIP
jgi:hypothetical protein